MFISQIFSGNLTPLLQKLSLKSLSETEISNQDGFPSSSWGGAIPRNLSLSHFWSENVTFLRDYDVITRDFFPKIGESPRKSQFQPGMHSGMCVPTP